MNTPYGFRVPGTRWGQSGGGQSSACTAVFEASSGARCSDGIDHCRCFGDGMGTA